MDNKNLSNNWRIRVLRVSTLVSILLAIVLLITFIFSLIISGTKYTYEYKEAKRALTSVGTGDMNETTVCYFPDCSSKAERYIISLKFFNDIYDGDTMEMLFNLPNKGGLKWRSDSFETREKEEVTYYDEYNVLTIDNRGRIRVDPVEDKYTLTINGKKITVSFVEFYGYYCDKHFNEVFDIWKAEVDDAFTSDFGYIFTKYGWIFAVAVIPVGIILPTVIASIIHSITDKKAKQE